MTNTNIVKESCNSFSLKRPQIRFSLRTLLLAITLACAVFGWVGIKWREIRLQVKAIAAIETHGGHFLYDYDFDETGNVRPTREPNHRSWFGKLVGDEWGQHVHSVNLTDLNWSDDDMPQLVALKNLAGLGLGNTRVTDLGLRHLLQLTQLRHLYLDRTQITDDGLKYLRNLTQLESLDLHDTQVSDAGLAHLRHLRSLRYLNLTATHVTHGGCNELQELLSNVVIFRPQGTLQSSP